MVDVYHRAGAGRWPVGFEHVAQVEATDADMAFRLTQHGLLGIEHWAQNTGVTCLLAWAQVRSTSVGDVVVVGGEVLECLPLGWTRIV